MIEKLKKFIEEKKIIRKKSKIYDFEEEEKEEKKLRKVNFWDRIQFIRFSKKTKEKNEQVNLQKIKEVGLLVTAAVLIGIGYTNFSANSGIVTSLNSNTIATSSTNSIGDVQLVSSSSAVVENDEEMNEEKQMEYTNALVSNEENSGNDTSANSMYFSELKMERKDMYSKSIETYQNIINSTAISNEQKAIAIQEIENLNEEQNKIEIAEKLIKLKDFEDVVIYSSGNKVNVIVRAVVLSSAQVAQIQNIVSKELNVSIADITISNK